MGIHPSHEPLEVYKFDRMDFHFDFRFSNSSEMVDKFLPSLFPIQGNDDESV